MSRKKKANPIEIPTFATEEQVETNELVVPPEISSESSSEPENSEMTLNEMIAIIKDAYQQIPFRNSYYEIRNFELGGSVSPARTYREIGKSLIDELLRFFEEKLFFVNLENEMETLTQSLDYPMRESEKKEKHAQIDVIAVKLLASEHAVQEALDNISYLFNEFKKYPRFTRHDIESQEEKHYLTKSLQSGTSGIPLLHEMLINSGERTKALIELMKKKIS